MGLTAEVSIFLFAEETLLALFLDTYTMLHRGEQINSVVVVSGSTRVHSATHDSGSTPSPRLPPIQAGAEALSSVLCCLAGGLLLAVHFKYSSVFLRTFPKSLSIPPLHQQP